MIHTKLARTINMILNRKAAVYKATVEPSDYDKAVAKPFYDIHVKLAESNKG